MLSHQFFIENGCIEDKGNYFFSHFKIIVEVDSWGVDNYLLYSKSSYICTIKDENHFIELKNALTK